MSFEYQRKMKHSYGKTHSKKDIYWGLYKKGVENREKPGIIVRISEEFNTAPCLMAKVILHSYFKQYGNSEKQTESSNINTYLRDTSSIPDTDLAYEIFLVSQTRIS